MPSIFDAPPVNTNPAGNACEKSLIPSLCFIKLKISAYRSSITSDKACLEKILSVLPFIEGEEICSPSLVSALDAQPYFFFNSSA